MRLHWSFHILIAAMALHGVSNTLLGSRSLRGDNRVFIVAAKRITAKGIIILMQLIFNPGVPFFGGHGRTRSYLEGAMVVARAAGSRRVRKEPAWTQFQGGKNKKKRFNNKPGGSGVSFTPPSQCKRCGQTHSAGYTCHGAPRTFYMVVVNKAI
ncbi:hypothetical protein Drorol1_Dr00026795 [Drosera rotundifolia]